MHSVNSDAQAAADARTNLMVEAMRLNRQSNEATMRRMMNIMRGLSPDHDL